MLRGRRVATGRALRSRTQVAAFCRLSGAFHDRGGRTGYGGLGCPAKVSSVPLCVLLGGSVGPVKAYNSNGLWLQAPEVVAAEAIACAMKEAFTALKLRLGRDRASDDLAAIHAIRAAVGDDMELMADFNQGLTSWRGSAAVSH